MSTDKAINCVSRLTGLQEYKVIAVLLPISLSLSSSYNVKRTPSLSQAQGAGGPKGHSPSSGDVYSL